MSPKDAQKKFEELIALCDSLIKSGKIAEVTDHISKLNFAKVPRESRQGLAKICRRAGLVGQGLHLLQPVIRNEKTKTDPATPGEICEYSVLLSRNGSVHEAMGLLKSVESTGIPEALLYLGYCHISNWEYIEAVGFLEKYLASTADDYAKLIARVNLASAYVETGELSRAENLLMETVPIAEQTKAHRLIGNCFEIWGQVHLYKNEFEKSRQALNRALEIFGNGQSYDQLLIYKTQSIISALEAQSLEPLIQFRKEAQSRRHWESVRDADLFTLKIQFQQELLDQLYFGTPMKVYRDRIQQVGKPSESHVYGKRNSLLLDLKTGQVDGSKHLNPGKKIHQVIAALVKDSYVPRNLGTLYAELYPNEHFDINSSPSRVKQLLVRTRQWLKENQIPAAIEQNDGAYRLVIRGNFGIQMSFEESSIDPFAVRLQELKNAFASKPNFTADEACSQLNWSRSTYLRFTEWALKNGALHKTGTGKATRYNLIALPRSENSRKVA